MRGVGPPSRAWEARVIAVIRHPQNFQRISSIDMMRQDIKFNNFNKETIVAIKKSLIPRYKASGYGN